ncbi:MAG: 4-hydroxy-3-methylbut-2-enyl diphosphate reductase [Elusimicrobiales bacterium]
MPESDIIIAKTAGFCPGVKKAIDCALDLARDARTPVYTLGPLIHNPQVIETLESKNIRALASIDEAAGQTGVIVIRAHGITPQDEARLRALAPRVVDATCPLVKRVHNVISKYAQAGYDTVIVGDKGHAEVTGLLGYAKGRGHVVSGPDEAERLPAFDKANIVAQTTQEEEIFFAAAEAVKKKSRECVVSDTICQPTRERQKETRELARNADAVIIVGGRQSANTARLAQLCRRLCANVIAVETEDELPPLPAGARVAVTAGASTPGWMIERVAERARALKISAARPSGRHLRGLWGVFVGSGAYAGLAAVCLAYVCMKMEGVRADARALALAWSFVFSLTIINRAREAAVSDREKPPAFRRRRLRAASAGIAAGVLAMALAWPMGPAVLFPVVFFWLLGLAYPFRQTLNIRRVMDFPGSKDFVTALGWGFVCAYVPAFYERSHFSAAALLAVAYAVPAVFVRSAALGMSAVHGDLIVGKESFYKAHGRRATLLLMFAMTAAMALWLGWLSAAGWRREAALPMLAASLYTLALLAFYYTGRIPAGALSETAVEAQFLLAAALAFARGFFY